MVRPVRVAHMPNDVGVSSPTRAGEVFVPVRIRVASLSTTKLGRPPASDRSEIGCRRTPAPPAPLSVVGPIFAARSRPGRRVRDPSGRIRP